MDGAAENTPLKDAMNKTLVRVRYIALSPSLREQRPRRRQTLHPSNSSLV